MQTTETQASDTEFRLVGARVMWQDQYDNDPHIQVLATAEVPWKDMLFESHWVGTSGTLLSSEQMQAIGKRPKGRKRKELLVAKHPSGLVRFVAVGSDNDYPRGAGGGTYKMVDGTERTISSGWYVSPSLLTQVPGMGHVVDVSVNTPKYNNVNMAGSCDFAVVKSLLARTSPHVAWEGTVPYFAGLPTKARWRELERERIHEIKGSLMQEYGLKSMATPAGSDLEYGEWNKKVTS